MTWACTAGGTTARGLFRRVARTTRAAASATATAGSTEAASTVITSRVREGARHGQCRRDDEQQVGGCERPSAQAQQPAGVGGQRQARDRQVAGEHRALAQVLDEVGEPLDEGRREGEDHPGDQDRPGERGVGDRAHDHEAQQRRQGDRPAPGKGEQRPGERPGQQRDHPLRDRLERGAGHRQDREHHGAPERGARQQPEVGQRDHAGHSEGGPAGGARRDPLGPGQHDPRRSGHRALRRRRGRPGRTPPRPVPRRSGWPRAPCGTWRGRPARRGARR